MFFKFWGVGLVLYSLRAVFDLWFLMSHVHPDCLGKYIEAPRLADAAVRERERKSEPDMLHNTFDN